MDSRGFVSEDQGECSESAQHYYQKNIDLQKELYEYMESSSLLEKELEASLDQKEKMIRELRQQNQKLDRENEFIKKKMDRTQQENTQLENEVKSMKIEKENRRIYIRELEQKNDDLERAQRVISESVAGIETLLNQAYERNAVLESELEEVENLRMKLQRASDETRDLKQELRVKDRIPNGNITSTPIQSANDTDNSRRLLNGLNGLDSSRLHNESETTNTQPSTPLKCDFSMNGINGMNGNTMTPSSRISALNIVGDLLRKVGLERFLCPECSKVRCICPKSDRNLSPQLNPQQSVHPSDNHQPVNRNPVRNLFSPSSLEKSEIPPTQNEDGFGTDNKRNSMPEPQSLEKHWLSGIMNNNSPSANQNGQNTPNAHHKSNVELRHNHPASNSNTPVQRNEPSAPRTLSLFSRGTSFRKSSIPPRPPRSPTKSRPGPPSSLNSNLLQK